MVLHVLALAAMLAGTGRQNQNLKYRWFYLQANFFVTQQVDRAVALIDRAAKAGYNGLVFTDTKLQSLSPYPGFYQTNVRRMRDEAAKFHMDVIPSVLPVGYADGMLARDPSLVESMPCKNVEYVANNGTLQLADSGNMYQNGGFESHDGDTFTGFIWQDGAGKSSFADTIVKHSGQVSLRIENPGTLTESKGNCRIVQKVTLKPWHQYRLTVWVKTQAFDRAGSVRAEVLDAGGNALSFGDIPIQSTQDWQQETLVFNSRGNSAANVYLGVWGGNVGKLWFDDCSLIDVGLLNVTRRPGCLLTIVGLDGTTYAEGEDVDPIADPAFGNVPWPGEFDFTHVPPNPRLASASRITNGQHVNMGYYAAAYTDIGKTAICLSEPAADRLIQDEISRVLHLFHPRCMFFAHDEIRVMNWCEACQSRKLTPGQILAQNVGRASELARSESPGLNLFIWSDMFDPYHNSVDNYYLANGTLKGSWEGLPKDIVIVNWNSSRAKDSLAFFGGHHFKQILAGYYDGPVNAIKPWLKEGQDKRVVGAMYTTWINNYDDLEAFAKAAWGG